MMRKGFGFFSNLNKIQHCSFSLSFLCVSCMHAASGLFSSSLELLAFSSRQFAPKIVKLSVRFVRVLFYILVSERSGRRSARGAKRLVLHTPSMLGVSSIFRTPGTESIRVLAVNTARVLGVWAVLKAQILRVLRVWAVQNPEYKQYP